MAADDPVAGDLPSAADIEDMCDALASAVDSTYHSLDPVIKRLSDDPSSFDFSQGLSLLLLRPSLLLGSIHNLVILLGLQLSSATAITPSPSTALPPARFADAPPARALEAPEDAAAEIERQAGVVREVMDRVRGLESKVAYQIRKLVALADASAATEAKVRAGKSTGADGEAEDADEADDPLAFRPNPAALISAAPAAKGSRDRRRSSPIASGRRRGGSDDEDDAEDKARDGVYRPPRVAAVPYNEGRGSSRRAERRAPALLTEFASSLTSAPVLESTSGLAVRPAALTASGESATRTNSASAARLAELRRMTEFEEENMTRLVTTKRDAKRREEDEAALMLGYGVGGGARSRSRRQGGFEAELEGVLGDRGGKSMWDDVGRGALGRREGLLDRSRKRGVDDDGGEAPRGKKNKFQKMVKKNRRK